MAVRLAAIVGQRVTSVAEIYLDCVPSDCTAMALSIDVSTLERAFPYKLPKTKTKMKLYFEESHISLFFSLVMASFVLSFYSFSYVYSFVALYFTRVYVLRYFFSVVTSLFFYSW